MEKSVAIVGMGPGWNQYKTHDCSEVWALNMGGFLLEKFDRWFMTDPIERRSAVLAGKFALSKDETIPMSVGIVKERIREINAPFVSAWAYPDLEQYESYPLEEVVGQFGIPYFVNTISYMIAYAMLKGYKRIALFGVNQQSASEYMYHKPCVEFWIGMALGQGIQVEVHGNRSEVCQNTNGILYGYRVSYPKAVELLKEGKLIIKK